MIQTSKPRLFTVTSDPCYKCGDENNPSRGPRFVVYIEEVALPYCSECYSERESESGNL